jgi:hypothetical protein
MMVYLCAGTHKAINNCLPYGLNGAVPQRRITAMDGLTETLGQGRTENMCRLVQ